MRAISRYLLLFVLVMRLLVYSGSSVAQSVGNPVVTANRTMVTLGISGEVSRFCNDVVEMKSQRGMLKINLTIFPGVDIFGKWGRGDLTFSDSDSTHNIDRFRFEPEFIYGGGLQWDFFHSSRANMDLIWQAQALWFNPDGKTCVARGVGSGTWQDCTYLIFEGWELQSGVVAVVRGTLLDFYFGAEGKSYPYQVKMQNYLEVSDQRVIVDTEQWKKKAQVHLGYFLGIDLKISGNLRASVEVKNSNLCDLNVMLGISQIGPP